MGSNDIYDFVISGAGISGVILSKYLKENNFTFLTIERRDGIGGLWNYSDDPNITTVTKKTITTSSKQFTKFSDYEPKFKDNFLKWQDLLEYINDYAKHYNIIDSVKLNTKVVSVTKNNDGLWEISYETKGSVNKVLSKNFVVAGGAQSQKRTPLADKFGSKFDGEMYHSQEVKLNGVIKFKGKRVLVTGGGETASDMAMHAACVADRTVWAIPDGLHSIDRASGIVQANGKIDEFVWDELPSLKRDQIHRQQMHNKYKNTNQLAHPFMLGSWGHGVEEWQVDNYWYNKFPIKDGEVIYLVHSGKIKAKRQIIDMFDKMVKFSDGTSEEIDMVIEGIGYKKSFDYFVNNSLKTVDYDKLYRGFIHTSESGLYMIGMVRPMIGSVPGYVELQSQYIVDLSLGNMQLPSKEVMKENQKEEERYHRNLFEGCSRFRADIKDYRFYHYEMSNDMGRCPLKHLHKFSKNTQKLLLDMPISAGLFLWVGDSRKEKVETFLENIGTSQTIYDARRVQLLFSWIGRVLVEIFVWFDKYVFNMKGKSNLLVFGKGYLHYIYLVQQHLPVSIGAFWTSAGPFPLTHPYFFYKEIDIHTTSQLDLSFLVGMFSICSFLMNSVLSKIISVPNQMFVFAFLRIAFQGRKLFHWEVSKLESVSTQVLFLLYNIILQCFSENRYYSLAFSMIGYVRFTYWLWNFKTFIATQKSTCELE